MKRLPICLSLSFLASAIPAVLHSQSSVVTVDAVMNSASYMPSAPGRFGIAQGSMFVVFGSNLGPDVLEVIHSFPLPLSLAGTSVQVAVEGSAVDAIMIYTSARQVAAVLPSKTPVGDGTLTVTYGGVPSNPSPIKVVPSAFGIYTVSQTGRGPGAITDPDYRVNGMHFSANPGETLNIWGTGLGPVNGDERAGPLPGGLRSDVQVLVGTKLATLKYAGRSGCCTGLDQIAFDVPSGVEGCFVPLAVRAGGVVSNFASVSIASRGRECAMPAGIPVAALETVAAGGILRVGGIGLVRRHLLGAIPFSIEQNVAAAQFLTALDPGSWTVQAVRQNARQMRERVRQAVRVYKQKRQQRISGKQMPSNRQSIRPAQAEPAEETIAAGFVGARNLAPLLPHLIATISAVGSCSVLVCTFGGCGLSAALQSTPGNRGFGSPLDAGRELTLSGAAGLLAMSGAGAGVYRTHFTLTDPSGQLSPGDYAVTGPGGADVGPFTAHLIVTEPLTWTNKDALSEVDRSQDLSITWNASRKNGYVVVGGVTTSHTADSFGVFVCGESSAKGTFTVPSFVLSAMPLDQDLGASGSSPASGTVFLAVHPFSNTFTAPGLDLGYFSEISLDLKELPFR